MIWILFAVFFIALLFGIPIAFALGIASLAYLLAADIPLVIIPLKMYSGIDVFVLLSIPGFILAGNIMNNSGMTDRIIKFNNNLVGHIRGGLGLANIGASMIFAGISGTAIADTASIGSIMIPAMKKEGYEADFASAVTASSSTVGPIIPPSLPMIIAGSLTGLSIGKLFLAGAIPGLLLAFGLMGVSYYISVKKGHPKKSQGWDTSDWQGISGCFLGYPDDLSYSFWNCRRCFHTN
jgi:C4-dicarboxylate transporter DctM subunit